MFGILVYVAFRYEFSFAVGAVLAVIHDVLMTIGWYCLSGREFNATTVAAILTIIGFSTNDTIVIFDRIREDLKLGIRGTFREVMNQALNQTLSRTIITSGTVFLATLSLYIFGGGAINDFRLHLPGRHHHRHLLQHLHRQRAGPVVAQRAAAPDWRRSAGGRRSKARRLRCGTVAAWGGDMLALVEITPWHWVGFIACVLIFLALDLGVFHRHAHVGQVQGSAASGASSGFPWRCSLPGPQALARQEGVPPIRHRLPDRAVALDGQRLRHRPHLRLLPHPAGIPASRAVLGHSRAR